LDEICTELEKANKKDFNKALQQILQEVIQQHKRVIFNGDNYSEEWLKEAKQRGLANLKSTPEALEVVVQEESIQLFERHGVLTKVELLSRHEVYKATYATILKYEADCMMEMAKTMIIPAALDYQAALSETIKSVASVSKTLKSKATNGLLEKVVQETEKALLAVDKLAKAAEGSASKKILAAMVELREAVDNLEGLLPADQWPLPTYTEMLFIS
jgi:glutamine synthetase